ncbi:MAG: hypothetical protein AMS17_18285, partial [Spirochaetes bacterium DG_61]
GEEEKPPFSENSPYCVHSLFLHENGLFKRYIEHHPELLIDILAIPVVKMSSYKIEKNVFMIFGCSFGSQDDLSD